MRYTLRNLRPSVLLIPDAALRLLPGQTVVVGSLTSQIGALIAGQALEVVMPDAILPAPAMSLPVAEMPSPSGEEAALMTEPRVTPQEKRGRKPGAALTPPVTMEPAHVAE